MPNNKNQHFVPQFYLKNFSTDKKSISSFHIESEKLLPLVSIRNQCSKNYFYPDLKYEQNLGKFEEQCRIVINKVVSGRKTAFSKSDIFWLRAFTILQKCRTQHEACIARDSIEEILEYLRSIGMTEDLKKEILGYENNERNAVALLTSTFKTGLFVTADMSCKILEYDGDGAFLTSDDPVIVNNPFLEKRGKMNYGLSAMGLIVILPLSRCHAILLYDSNIYKVGHMKEQVVRFNNRKDLDWINLLTVLHADKVLFFEPGTQDYHSLSNTVRRAKSIGQTKNMKFEALVSEDGRSELLHTYGDNFYIGATFSFLKILDKARNIHFGNTIGVLDYSRPYCNALLALQRGGPSMLSMPSMPSMPTMTYRPK